MPPKILIIGARPCRKCCGHLPGPRPGVRATVVDRGNIGPSGTNAFKVGESLPPAAETLLSQLGIWASFQAAGHLNCYNNRSYWHSEQPTFTDFITQPPGYGWHLDRVAFERQLVGRAREIGVRLLSNTKLEYGRF